jgi:class 3 adenylate cyclase
MASSTPRSAPPRRPRPRDQIARRRARAPFLAERGAAHLPAHEDRALVTLLVTDIVGSTQTVAELGDRAWLNLIERHHEVVRTELTRFRGREVDASGDGTLATFDGPARAVRCATAILSALRPLGLNVRAGVHTGEVELDGDRVRGVALDIAARVAAEAAPGEVLVSQTVNDIVAGSGLEFADRGSRALAGVPGEWRLLAVIDRDRGGGDAPVPSGSLGSDSGAYGA